MPREPTLSNVNDSANAASDLTIVVQKSFSSQPISDILESLLVAKKDVISRILVFVIDEYVFFCVGSGEVLFSIALTTLHSCVSIYMFYAITVLVF